MENLLLNASENKTSIVAIIIFLALLVIAIVCFVVIKKKSITVEKNPEDDLEAVDVRKSMSLNIPFLTKTEVKFLTEFQRVLPSEYIVYPKVPMSMIIIPNNNMQFYNVVKDRIVDFVVFLKTNMQPIMVLDITDSTGELKTIESDEKMIFSALENVNLPIVVYEIKQDYDPIALLEKFLDALDPYEIAQLKKSRER